MVNIICKIYEIIIDNRQYMTYLRLLWIKLNAIQLIASLC